MDSTLVVTQQQASGKVRTYWYMITINHFMCSTLVAAQVVRPCSNSPLIILVTSHIHDAINKLSCNVVDSKSLMVYPVP